MKRVLVTDGESRPALAVVRSIGRARAGTPFVCSCLEPSIAGASRFAAGSARVPDPLTDPSGFVDAVLALVGEWRIDVVLPVSEPAHLAILAARARFGDVVIPAPELDAFLALTDKARVLAAAATLGIDVPAQLRLDSSAALDVERLPRFPLVIKPARTINGGSLHKVSYAGDVDALRRGLAALPPNAFPVMLQERISGYGAAVSLLRWDGETRAVFMHRRIRENPPSGGASAVSESVALDLALVERSRALLERFDWRGVAMVEFKIDRAGTPWLMEVNPRFWGSLQLAIDCGVDFPVLLLRSALGESVPRGTDYEVGLRLRHLWGDVDQLIARLRRSRAELSLPDTAPGRLRSVVELLTPHARQRYEVWRSDDLRPFVVETRGWLRGRLASFRRSARSRNGAG